jgi:solute carrier family 7 (L-type amino acid transporter), member 5
MSLPIIYLLTASFLVISSIFVSPIEVGVGVAIIILGVPVYYMTIHSRIRWLEHASQKLNMFCVKLFLCLPNTEKIE